MSTQAELRHQMSTILETLVANMPDPPEAAEVFRVPVQMAAEAVVSTFSDRLTIEHAPEVKIFLRPDRTYYFVIGYSNGRTYRPNCLWRRGGLSCIYDATEMVGPESLCGAHASDTVTERERHRQMIEAYADSPEGRAEARAEQRWESRVS